MEFEPFSIQPPNFDVQKLNRNRFVVILESIIAIWMEIAKIYRISKRGGCCPRAISLDRTTLIWIMSINQCVWVPEGSVDCIYVWFLFVYKCTHVLCTFHLGWKGGEAHGKSTQNMHSTKKQKHLNAVRSVQHWFNRECTQELKLFFRWVEYGLNTWEHCATMA